VNLILTDAVKKTASDIHIEPYEKSFRVRYRIDGVLYEVMKPPMKLKNAITSRVKIMSELDIAERRLPQDGRIKLKLGRGKEMDFRVSVLPTLFGEKIVLRLLDKGNLQLDMTKLGFEQPQLDVFKRSIHLPVRHGARDGPDRLRQDHDALLRARRAQQDHREPSPPRRTRRVQPRRASTRCRCTTRSGSNFAACLRSFLRQDPDIIMVGEIATSRPPRSRSRRRSPATWCSRRCTPTTRRPP
jgi:type IV pilus assembly protein PilB